MSDIHKCFEILNLPPNAPYEEAKSAYRELASILHPDKHMHNERLRVRATEKFQRLQSAWCQLEAYYKVENQERIRQEEYERQGRGRAEAERQREEFLREEAERREEERRTEEKKKSLSCTCPVCGVVNNILGGQSIDNLRCGACRMPLNHKFAMHQLAAEEWDRKHQLVTQKARMRTKKQVVTAVITTITYSIVLMCLGGWGIVITFFTCPLVFFFSLLGSRFLYDRD